jgi:hypothetical protein
MVIIRVTPVKAALPSAAPAELGSPNPHVKGEYRLCRDETASLYVCNACEFQKVLGDCTPNGRQTVTKELAEQA